MWVSILMGHIGKSDSGWEPNFSFFFFLFFFIIFFFQTFLTRKGGGVLWEVTATGRQCDDEMTQ